MGSPTPFKVGSWTATPGLNLLECDARTVRLEPRTMDVLVQLAQRPGEVVSVEALLASVWQGVVVGEGSVYHAIRQLRQALGAGDDAEYIETIPKRGYRLTVPVTLVDTLPGMVAATLADDAAVPESPDPGPTLPSPPSNRHRLAVGGLVLAALATTVALTPGWLRPPQSQSPLQRPAVRFVLPVPALSMSPASVAVSPDGRYIAYTADDANGRSLLHVHGLDSLESRVLPGTEGAQMPFWSPDCVTVGFRVGSELRRVSIAGGAPERIADIGAAPPGGATWNAAGDILVDGGQGLLRVPAGGGQLVRETTLAPGEKSHVLPVFLPDGRHFLYTSGFRDPGGVYVKAIGAAERRQVLTTVGAIAYASGYVIVNHLDGALTAQRFDPDRLEVSGTPRRLAEGVTGFSVSANGLLAYVVGMRDAWRAPAAPSQLAWFDRSGRRLGNLGEPGPYRGIALSPDGLRVAVHRHDETDVGDIWVFDAASGVGSRRTRNRAHNQEPVWSPDGSRILYGGAGFSLYEVFAAGDEVEKPVFDGLRFAWPTDWSGDGRTALAMFVPDNANQVDVAAIDLARGTAQPVLASPHLEAAAKWSPDGKWIAYTSDASGRMDVLVRAYPGGGEPTRISPDGGFAPRWSRDGRTLYFIAPDNRTLLAASVAIREGRLMVGAPRALFAADFVIGDHNSVIGPQRHTPYDVAPDGRRFLVNERLPPMQAPATRPPERGSGGAAIAVIVDWTRALEP